MFIENHLQTHLKDHDLRKIPPMSKVHPALTSGFAQANYEVCNMGTDVRYSGSTCVSLLTYGRHLFIANVGDSRAIIISQNPADPHSKCRSLSGLFQFIDVDFVFRVHREGLDEGPQAGRPD